MSSFIFVRLASTMLGSIEAAMAGMSRWIVRVVRPSRASWLVAPSRPPAEDVVQSPAPVNRPNGGRLAPAPNDRVRPLAAEAATCSPSSAPGCVPRSPHWTFPLVGLGATITRVWRACPVSGHGGEGARSSAGALGAARSCCSALGRGQGDGLARGGGDAWLVSRAHRGSSVRPRFQAPFQAASASTAMAGAGWPGRPPLARER